MRSVIIIDADVILNFIRIGAARVLHFHHWYRTCEMRPMNLPNGDFRVCTVLW